MQRFVDATRRALRDKNWYGALTQALTMPDICGKLESPNDQSGPRYVGWWERFVQPKYTRRVGAEQREHIFLSGGDAYALRCAYLHEGASDISAQRARTVLEDFLFVEPPERGLVHRNQLRGRLQLQVDLFSEDICEGVESWLAEMHKTDPSTIERMKSLVVIQELGPGFTL